MLFIVSPAKKMVDASDAFAWRDLPRFLPQARELLGALRGMSYEELKELWACSDALARLNFDRVQHMDLGNNTGDVITSGSAGFTAEGTMPDSRVSWQRTLTPSVFSYEGIQYQNMAPQVMTTEQLEYVQAHLRILSGFYGVLRPFDGVTPYRLEMQAKLAMPRGANGEPARNLYEFWGSRIYDALRDDLEGRVLQGMDTAVSVENDASSAAVENNAGPCTKNDCAIVNLASVEYAKAVEPYAKAAAKQGGPRYATCLFGSMKGDKFVQRATEAKAARGTFVRWCAENAIERVADFPRFGVGGYRFDEGRSTEDVLVFVR